MATEQRLIDANKLVEKFLSLTLTVTGLRAGKSFLLKVLNKYRNGILQLIDEQPTVDAVEVVRCKDCKHYELDEGDFLGECHCKRIPMNYSGELYPERDYFCAYGERKT